MWCGRAVTSCSGLSEPYFAGLMVDRADWFVAFVVTHCACKCSCSLELDATVADVAMEALELWKASRISKYRVTVVLQSLYRLLSC